MYDLLEKLDIGKLQTYPPLTFEKFPNISTIKIKKIIVVVPKQ